MKIDELARPGLIALGVVGIAATALLGFAAGMAVARDPDRKSTRLNSSHSSPSRMPSSA